MIPLRWIAIGSRSRSFWSPRRARSAPPRRCPGPCSSRDPWLRAGRALASPGARKPSASVAVDGRILASGKVRLTVTSNAKSVKVSYRTAQGKARTVV